MSSTTPLRRLWRLADPDRARLALAALLATLSLACGVGLLAVSAWLISRASQQPPILFLQVAIVWSVHSASSGVCSATPNGWSVMTRLSEA